MLCHSKIGESVDVASKRVGLLFEQVIFPRNQIRWPIPPCSPLNASFCFSIDSSRMKKITTRTSLWNKCHRERTNTGLETIHFLRSKYMVRSPILPEISSVITRWNAKRRSVGWSALHFIYAQLVFVDIYRNDCKKTYKNLPPNTKLCLLTAKLASCNLLLGRLGVRD